METPDAASTVETKCASEVGKAHVGFGKTDLNEDRVDALAAADRGRVKPYSALAGEFARVLGTTPDTLGGAAGTFDAPPSRWYTEPKGSAVALYAAYAVAFDGCLTYTATDPRYGAAPTDATATAECTTMTRKFWSRAGTSAEIKACADAIVIGAAAEPDPRRRWAYGCAAVLTSTGFTVY